jgi:hypothetical protein
MDRFAVGTAKIAGWTISSVAIPWGPFSTAAVPLVPSSAWTKTASDNLVAQVSLGVLRGGPYTSVRIGVSSGNTRICPLDRLTTVTGQGPPSIRESFNGAVADLALGESWDLMAAMTCVAG